MYSSETEDGLRELKSGVGENALEHVDQFVDRMSYQVELGFLHTHLMVRD